MKLSFVVSAEFEEDAPVSADTLQWYADKIREVLDYGDCGQAEDFDVEPIAVDQSCFRPGDAVIYAQPSRGGYGFQRDVPATFVKARARRHAIRVISADGSRNVIIHVSPKSLRSHAVAEAPASSKEPR